MYTHVTPHMTLLIPRDITRHASGTNTPHITLLSHVPDSHIASHDASHMSSVTWGASYEAISGYMPQKQILLIWRSYAHIHTRDAWDMPQKQTLLIWEVSVRWGVSSDTCGQARAWPHVSCLVSWLTRQHETTKLEPCLVSCLVSWPHVSSHDSHDNKHSSYDTPESCLLIWRNMRRHDSSYHCIRRHMRIVCVSCRETRLLLSLPHDSHDNKHSAYDTPESCLLIWGNMRRYDSSYRLIRVSESMGLFCRILSLLWDSFAKETCNLKEPTNRVLEDSILEDRERICVSTHTCSTHLRLETRVVSRVTHTTHYVWLIHICDMAYLYMY